MLFTGTDPDVTQGWIQRAFNDRLEGSHTLCYVRILKYIYEVSSCSFSLLSIFKLYEIYFS